MALVYGVKVNVPSNLIYVDSVGFCFSRYWQTSNLTGYDNRPIFFRRHRTFIKIPRCSRGKKKDVTVALDQFESSFLAISVQVFVPIIRVTNEGAGRKKADEEARRQPAVS